MVMVNAVCLYTLYLVLSGAEMEVNLWLLLQSKSKVSTYDDNEYAHLIPHMRLVCVTNQVHAGTEPSKPSQTKWEQYFHTIPPSCAILPTMPFVCYLLHRS